MAKKSEKQNVKKQNSISSKTVKNNSKKKEVKVEAKTDEKNIEKKKDIQKIAILVAIIIGVFGICWIIVSVFNKKNYDDIFEPETLGNTEIQYDEIIVGTILNQKASTYYVLVLEEDDTSYSNMLQQYKEYNYEYKIYTVDLGSTFNKNSVSEESSYEKDNMKFKGTTLLKIVDNEIDTVYENINEIEDLLNDLLEEAENNTAE